MNSHEFQTQYERLQRRYGDKNYDKDFSQILWTAVRDFPDGIFTKAVDFVISEHFKAIGKTAIVEIMSGETRKASSGPQSKFIEKPCLDCDGFGLVYMVDPEGGRWTHSCDYCANGKLQRETGIKPPRESLGLKRGLRNEKKFRQTRREEEYGNF